MQRFSDFDIKGSDGYAGDKIKIEMILNREIIVSKFKTEDSKFSKNKSGKCLFLQIELSGSQHIVFTGSDNLLNQISQTKPESFPFLTTIIKNNKHYEFT